MRILIAHNDYARPSGEEFAIRQIAELLTNSGHEVRWLHRSSANLQPSVHGNFRAAYASLFGDDSPTELRHLVAEHQPDFLLAQNLYPLLSPSILTVARQLGVSVVMRCPNYRLFCPIGTATYSARPCETCWTGIAFPCITRNCAGSISRSSLYALRHVFSHSYWKILNQIDYFVVLSSFQETRFHRQGISTKQTRVIPNVFSVAKQLLPEPPTPGYAVGFAGRIAPEKGIHVFLNAARILPETRFLVAGHVADRMKSALSIPPNVNFLGHLSGNELDDFYRRLLLLVIPSTWYEGLPNTALRAMSMNRLVVASDIGGLPELLDHGRAGVLFPTGDAQALATILRSVISSPDTYANIVAAARHRVLSRHSPEAVSALWNDIFEKRRDSRLSTIPFYS